MKKLVILVSFLMNSALGLADVIVLKADEWCPYNCAKDGEDRGYIIEAVDEIFKEKGHTIKYEVMNWKRVLQEAKNGKTDGIIGATEAEASGLVLAMEEDKKSGKPQSIEQGINHDCFFAKKDSAFQYNGVKSLESVIMGGIAEYEYGGDVPQYISKNKDSKKLDIISGDDASEQNIKKLDKGRIDVYLESEYVFLYLAKKLKQKNVITSEFKQVGCANLSGEKERIFIAFSPVKSQSKAKEYSKILAEGWVKLRESGKLAQILTKYNLKDWK